MSDTKWKFEVVLASYVLPDARADFAAEVSGSLVGEGVDRLRSNWTVATVWAIEGKLVVDFVSGLPATVPPFPLDELLKAIESARQAYAGKWMS